MVDPQPFYWLNLQTSVIDSAELSDFFLKIIKVFAFVLSLSIKEGIITLIQKCRYRSLIPAFAAYVYNILYYALNQAYYVYLGWTTPLSF